MSKFRVGDKVRVVGNSDPKHYFNVGDVVEVTGLSGFGECGEIELRGHCAWQEPGETGTQYLSLSDIEPATLTDTFTIGQTYKTANRREFTCIYTAENRVWMVGHNDSPAYLWDGNGKSLSLNDDYDVVFEPVRETVTVEGSFHHCANGQHKAIHHYIGDHKFTLTIDKLDGEFDWTTAKVTPCT